MLITNPTRSQEARTLEVMLVGGDAAMRIRIAQALNLIADGIRLWAVPTVEVAVKRLRERRYALVITDQDLPTATNVRVLRTSPETLTAGELVGEILAATAAAA